ncbi:MAG: hypothetical protein A2162_03535 [Deltaproteobacteria bacterium RBG_13_52_11b]|nr:MAG: hypothetical protein A2162_03535 [Deltaproteobacteria bacterium RBG_13_52_11b]
MGNRMVIFCCSLTMAEFDKNNSFGHFTVERRNSQDEISDEEMERLLFYWNRDIKLRQIRERFAKGAVLWLAKSKSETTALGWSIVGKTIRPYFFPLRRYDSHLFDYEVFPDFRGQGVNRLLVNHVLAVLKTEGVNTAYIETYAWNEAEIRSLSRTIFKKLGEAIKFQFFGKTVVVWAGLKEESQSKAL